MRVFGSTAILAVAAVLLLSMQHDAAAQTQSLFGSRGQSMARGASSGISGGNQSGSSLIPTPVFNSPTLPQPGQQTTLDGTSTLVGDQFIGRGASTGEFVGRRGATGTGASQLGGQPARRNLNATGIQRRANANGNAQQSSDDLPATGTNSRARAIRIQSRHRIAFTHSSIPVASVQSRLEQRFRKSEDARLAGANLNFTVDKDGVLYLRGRVPTMEEKELTEIIARMEPGVREVRNELTVVEAPAPE